jgi:hypothetical protein
MGTTLLHRRATPHPIRRAAGLGFVTLAVAGLMAWTPGIAAAWNQSAAESTLWQLLNGDRANNGVRPVLQNSTLVSLARWRSKDMIQRDYFSHTILGTNYMVFHWYDTSGLRYSWGGENIGWNSGYSDGDSPVAINNSFMNSVDHRDNILNKAWTHGGVGAYGADSITWGGKLRSPRMYTELFMQAKSTAPAPTPRPTARPTTRPAPKPTPKPAPKATPKPTAKPTPGPAATTVAFPFPALAVLEGDLSVTPASALARASLGQTSANAGTTVASYRVDAAPPADRGFFETLLGTFLGFSL